MTLKFRAICFNLSLKADLSYKLELQQRKSLAIIIESQYCSYNRARSLTQLPILDYLWEKAYLELEIKALTNSKHSHLFPLNESNVSAQYRNQFIWLKILRKGMGSKWQKTCTTLKNFFKLCLIHKKCLFFWFCIQKYKFCADSWKFCAGVRLHIFNF